MLLLPYNYNKPLVYFQWSQWITAQSLWVEPNYDTILLYGVGSAGGNGSIGDGDGSAGVGAGVVR